MNCKHKPFLSEYIKIKGESNGVSFEACFCEKCECLFLLEIHK